MAKELAPRTRITNRLSALRNEATEYFKVCKDVRDFIAPRTYGEEQDRSNNKNKREDQRIINITPRLALRTGAAGMMSGITSPARPWFRLTTADPDMMEVPRVKEFLYWLENQVRTIFAKSNLYQVLPTVYRSMLAYGTASMGIIGDPDTVIRCYPFKMGSYYGAQDHRLVPDTFYRVLPMSVSQMVKKFGNNVSRSVMRSYDIGNYEDTRWVLQAIEPNGEFKAKSVLAKDRAFSSVYLDLTDNSDRDRPFLEQSGYEDFPVMLPRWDTNGEEFWGNGPGEVALGACKAIQLEETRKYQAIDVLARPPMIADASLRNDRVGQMPGEVTFVTGMAQGNTGLAPAYLINPRIQELKEDIAQTEIAIKQALFYDMFMAVNQLGDQPNITATQISIMREEVMLQLGPTLERLNNELLGPLINRTITEMMKRGMIPQDIIPDELRDNQPNIEYISILAQAQKALAIGGIERFTGFVTALAGVNPEVLDKFDADQAIDEYATAAGVPPTIVVSDEKVAVKRQDRAQQQATAMAAELAPKVAGAVKDLSQANMGGNNALTRSVGLSQ